MVSIGPSIANVTGSNFDIGPPAAQWSNASNIAANDGSTADVTVASPATDGILGITVGSDNLTGRNNTAFSAIAAADTINGVTVGIYGWTNVGNVDIWPCVNGTSSASGHKTLTLTTVHQLLNAGSSSDVWTGAGTSAPYNATTISGSGPGVDIFVGTGFTDTVHIDYVQFTVDYTVAVTLLPLKGMNVMMQSIMRWLGLEKRFLRRKITSRCYPEIVAA